MGREGVKFLLGDGENRLKPPPHPCPLAARFARRGLRPRPARSKARGDPSHTPAEGEGDRSLAVLDEGPEEAVLVGLADGVPDASAV